MFHCRNERVQMQYKSLESSHFEILQYDVILTTLWYDNITIMVGRDNK